MASVYRFRWPRPWRSCSGALRRKGGEDRAAPDDGPEHLDEAPAVGVPPLVEPERLLVEVAEEMERLDADVGAFDVAFQERPEVFEPVGVDLAARVGFGVVDDLVRVVGRQAFIRLQRVGVDFLARRDG